MKPDLQSMEILKIRENRILTFTIEVFKVSLGYKCFARNNLVHHQELVGSGFHEDKEKSINKALKELRDLMS